VLSLGKTILIIVLLTFLQGCTLHFKATDVELQTEQPRSQRNITYGLEAAGLLSG